MTKHRHKPACQACGVAPAELKPNGRGWKSRCSECQRNFELATDRQRVARRRLERQGAQA
jgi:tRNA(Ile2) C34 agmatinyltransferase TiaS